MDLSTLETDIGNCSIEKYVEFLDDNVKRLIKSRVKH